ncbi:winged helix-turn-helix domain-containing protein [Nocardioides sp.]|uniref:winged helix-turn-helix domain-containing protein n=1 Tax=Nocardioides sp. TaxID=35761 RepID=UPI001997569E|nr:winged helix-turn-helix domain-containing protein [Nocardioides sp.]MBC7278237.1 winged helix-turn-helix transcriptional regulator [Nocardioides sp.]
MPPEVPAGLPHTHDAQPHITLDRFNGPLLFDDGGIRLLRDTNAIGLTIAEWRILRLLHDHVHQAVPRKLLLIAAANGRHPGSDRSLDTHISRLRDKIETEPTWKTARRPNEEIARERALRRIIHTVNNYGYRLDPR